MRARPAQHSSTAVRLRISNPKAKPSHPAGHMGCWRASSTDLFGRSHSRGGGYKTILRSASAAAPSHHSLEFDKWKSKLHLRPNWSQHVPTYKVLYVRILCADSDRIQAWGHQRLRRCRWQKHPGVLRLRRPRRYGIRCRRNQQRHVRFRQREGDHAEPQRPFGRVPG